MATKTTAVPRFLARVAPLPLVLLSTLAAQERTVFEGLPAIVLSNGTLTLSVVPEGGAMASVTLADDQAKINPLWNPYWIAREAKLDRPTNYYRGHFVCVDGFGPASSEERDAGLTMHGEAYTRPWELKSFTTGSGSTSATFAVSLPLVHETFTRTYRMVDGENIVWVESELESLLGFDRPVFWGEHATLSAPFLEPGKVAVDLPVVKGRTKAYPVQAAATRRLQSYADFTWPLAPTVDGGTFDARTAPMQPGTTDHFTSLIDPGRTTAFVTALHAERRLLIGWVFKRADFPWVQTWLSHPGPNRMARGLEFATQPYDLPRAEVLRQGPLFDTPVFRILPAKSTITANFLMFYTPIPDGFLKVDDVQLRDGRLVIEDRGNRKTITLTASRTL
jgi:hypothetical protein